MGWANIYLYIIGGNGGWMISFMNPHWIKEGGLPSWSVKELHWASSSLGGAFWLREKKLGKEKKKSKRRSWILEKMGENVSSKIDNFVWNLV
jgi:hypothetical protein